MHIVVGCQQVLGRLLRRRPCGARVAFRVEQRNLREPSHCVDEPAFALRGARRAFLVAQEQHAALAAEHFAQALAAELSAPEVVGCGKRPMMDLAVDPLEATESVAYGRYNAISVIVAGAKGSLLHAPDTYMEKIAAGPQAAQAINLDASNNTGAFVGFNAEL